MTTNFKTENKASHSIIADVRRMWRSFRAWWREQQKARIMYVSYDLTDNTLIAYDWISQKISPFSGKFSSAKWNELKEYCEERTTIYVWAGMQKKHLAYNEPIQNYLADENLLRTGQGFHFGSGKRYGEVEKPKCPCCGRHYA